MAAEFEINWEDPQLWQHLGVIIGRFEKAALKSESRDGLTAIARGPLEATDMLLEGAESMLTSDTWGSTKGLAAPEEQPDENGRYEANRVKETVAESNNQVTNADGDVVAAGSAVGVVSAGVERPEQSESDVIGTVPKPSVQVGFDINADADFAAIFPDGEVGNRVAEEIMNCAGMGADVCKPQIKFKWQMQPIDLLGPLGDLVDSLNNSIDGLNSQLDPFSLWQNFCEIGEEFKPWCLPDLIMMLMALKVALRKYLSFQLEIALDWTVILAPLLKIITEIISGLVSAIVAVMVSPIECAMSAVASVATAQRELNAALAAAAAVGQRIGDTAQQTGTTVASVFDGEPGMVYEPVDGEEANIGVTEKSVEQGLKNPQAGRKAIVGGQSTSSELPPPPPKKVATGIDFSSIRGMQDSFQNQEFINGHWSDQVLAALQDARLWITDLDDKLQQALSNLNILVSGAFSITIGNIGILLLIKDLIGLVSTMISMLAKLSPGERKANFCDIVEANPDILRAGIQRTAGRAAFNLELDALGKEGRLTNELVALYKGPERVGTINCTNQLEGTPQGELIKRWISELGGTT